MNYLVTGGAGFIGCHLIRRLADNPKNALCCVDNLTYAGNLQRLKSVRDHSNFRFVKGDIGDAKLMKQVLQEVSPDIVINLAAETHVDNSIVNPKAFIQTNIVGVEVLLSASLEFWKSLPENRAKGFRFY